MFNCLKKSSFVALQISTALIGCAALAVEGDPSVGNPPVKEQECSSNLHSNPQSVGFLNGLNFKILNAQKVIYNSREKEGESFSPLLLPKGNGTLKELHYSIESIRDDLIEVSQSVRARKYHPNDAASPKINAQLASRITAVADQLGQLNSNLQEFYEEYESRLNEIRVKNEYDMLAKDFLDNLKKADHWIYLTLKLPRISEISECNE